MFQIWFARCSGILFGANEISMLTVDHFARDEHVSKTGKSACVRMVVWKVQHTLRTSQSNTDRIRADFSPSGLGTDHIAQKTRALTGKVISGVFNLRNPPLLQIGEQQGGGFLKKPMVLAQIGE